MSLIDEARKKINAIDEEMVKLFEERMTAVLDVLKYKKEHNLAVFDSKREEEIIAKNISLLQENVYVDIYSNGKLYYIDLSSYKKAN